MNQNNMTMSGALKRAWFAGILLAFVYLVLRNTGLQPIVMADEWYYSSFSRLMPFAEVSVPSYLYLMLFKATTACGPGYLECARVMNVVFFIGAAPLIYLVARRFMNPAIASAVSLLSILGPINGYTAYFMPESLYFFAFWLLSCSVFRFYDVSCRARAIEIGAVLSILALIKVHALFLIPSVAVFMIYCVYSKPIPNAQRARDTVTYLVLALATAAALRFGFGFMCAGRSGLSLFGALYGAQAAQSNATHAQLAELIRLILLNLRGHLLGLALLFGVPLAALASRVASFRSQNSAGLQRSLALYSFLMLLALLAVTVGFTASVAGSGQESDFRLHMRYYNFAFPLLTMMAATYINANNTPLPRALVMSIALPISIVILYGIVKHWQPYTPSFVDSPEFQGMTSQVKGFHFLSGLGLVSMICWVYNQRLGARVFIGVFMPLFTILAGVVINHEIRSGGAENQFDRAAAVAHSYLNEQQRSRIGVVSSDPSGLFRTQFHLDNLKVWQHMAVEGAPIDTREIPSGIDWLVVLGNHPLPPGAAIHLKNSEFSIVELNAQFPGHFSYEFSSGVGGLLEQTEGLSGIEPWGRWSDQKIVSLHFAKALPQHFKLGLLAEAFGPNAGSDVIVKVGSQTQVIQFEKAKKNVELTFETDGTQKLVTIEVPKPTSPSSLGLGEDGRSLGIGFTKMSIDDLTTPTSK
jgi:phosphoglycerol transferase